MVIAKISVLTLNSTLSNECLNKYQLGEGQVSVDAAVEGCIAEAAVAAAVTATTCSGTRLSMLRYFDLKTKKPNLTFAFDLFLTNIMKYNLF